MTQETETLRSLVKDTMGLLRELTIEQGRQVAEIREVLPEVRETNKRLERLYVWKEHIDKTLSELCTQQAVDEFSRTVTDRDESRAYEDRKSIWKTILDISVKLAGVAALIIALME